MAVLMIADINGQTQQGYDGMIAALGDVLRQAPGLILHSGHATADGWRVVEVWHSKAAATDFYARVVAPMLPPGIRPRRAFQELHVVLTSSLVPA